MPAFAVVGALAVASQATADAPGTCTMGSPYDTGLTLFVDGVSQASGGTGVFGPYAVSLCHVMSNGPGQGTDTYNFSVGRTQGNNATGLTAGDTAKTFTITFTPQAGDTPLAAEGKANIQSFSIDALNGNAVTLAAQPLGFADIQGCQTMPTQCVVDHQTASFFNPANLTGAVRYSRPSGEGAAGFNDLPGLTTSSGAFIFFVWASCPSGLKIDLGGPHLMPDGQVNTTMLRAYLPAAAVASCFGASPQAYAASALVTRTEGGVTTTASTGVVADPGLRYVITPTDAGVTISVPQVTFSLPTYGMSTKSGRSLAKVKKTTASLAKRAKVTKPSGGRLTTTIAKSSKRVCVATTTTVYGFGKGTCRYTATSYSAAGKKIKSAKGSFTVR